MTRTARQLGALLYPGFEMLDYFGPLEMFSVVGSDVVRIRTVAEQAGPTEYVWNRDADNDPSVSELNDLARQLWMV